MTRLDMRHLMAPVTPTPPSAAELMESVPGWLLGATASELGDRTSTWGEQHCRAAAWAMWRQGIGPLLGAVLAERWALEVLPTPLQAHLQEELALSRKRNAILLGDLVAILHGASRAGTDVLPLKGSLLASLYYDHPALRPMSDLDLLAHPEEWPALIDVLRQRHYVLARQRSRHIAFARHGKTASDVVRLGEHPDNPMNVEIHPHLAGDVWGLRYRLTEAMWANSSPGTLLGAPARLLTPRALARHVLIHAATNMIDRTLRAIHLYDLSILAPQLEQGDWEALCSEVEGTAETRLLYAPLALADRWLGAPVAPPDVLAGLRQASPACLVRFVDRAPLSQMTICGFAWPRRPQIPWAWYAPGREWLSPVTRLLTPAAADLCRLSEGRATRSAWASAYLRRFWRVTTYPARRLRRLMRRTSAADSAATDGESH